MGELQRFLHLYKASVNVCNEDFPVDNFFKVAQNLKLLANMPNAFVWKEFCQRLPSGTVTLKEMSVNGRDAILKIEKLTKSSPRRVFVQKLRHEL